MNLERVIRLLKRVPKAPVLVIAWYVMLFAIDGYAREHYEAVHVLAPRMQMSSEAPVAFGYGLAFAALSMLPPILLAGRRAIRYRLVPSLVGSGSAVAAVSTIVFYVGASDCRVEGENLHFYVLAGAALGIPLLAGLIAGRANPVGFTITIGLGVAAVVSFLIFLQGGDCHDAYLDFPDRQNYPLFWFPFALPIATAGALVGRGIAYLVGRDTRRTESD